MILAAATLSPSTTGHPYHSTQAEAELSAETGRLEVALKVIPEDLERALGRRTGTEVSLEKTPEVDALILAYLTENFRILTEEKSQPLSWVGKEVSAQNCWLYFEAHLSQELQGSRLRNTLFFELEAGQVNVVRIKMGHKRRSFLFNRERPESELDFGRIEAKDGTEPARSQ